MLHYLKAAFFAGIDVPGLGHVPVNVLGVAACIALGFLYPVIWYAGAALELLFLFTLAGNARFRRAVDAQDLVNEDTIAQKRLQLIDSLPQAEQRRFTGLLARFERLEEVFRSQQADDFILDQNRNVLRRLEWAYLKLLVAQANIGYMDSNGENEETLRARILALDSEARTSDPPALRESRAATIAILSERIANIRRRADTLQEIAADLNRIEAQVDLMIDNAVLACKPRAVSVDFDLATDFGRGALFGDSQAAVDDLDRALGTPAAHPAVARATEHS